MKTQEHKNNRNNQKGVALLFVILLTSVLLMVTIGISNITFKELVFSLEARDSDKAFFAADTGMECAMYLDKLGTFVATPPTNNCNGTPVAVNTTGIDQYQFALPLGTECVNVTINTALDPLGTGELYTGIQSTGYNTTVDSTTGECPDGSVMSRVVSRAVSLSFPNGGTGTGSAPTYPPTLAPIPSDLTPVGASISGGVITLTGKVIDGWPIMDVGFNMADLIGGPVRVIPGITSITPVVLPTPGSPTFSVDFLPSSTTPPLANCIVYRVYSYAQNSLGNGYTGVPTNFMIHDATCP